LALLVLAASPQEQEKSPPPSSAEQSEAEKMIKDIFKDDYAKRGQPERQALARQLLSQALQSKDEPKIQFVLFREAKDLATQAGDAATALSAVDELSQRFAVDAAALKTSVLAGVGKAAKTPEEIRPLVLASLRLVDSALLADEYESAEKTLASAAGLLKKIQDVPLNGKVLAKSREIAELKAKFAKIKKARETLAANPDDETSNLVFGQFLCLQKGDWPRGLPLLAKGSDPATKALAQKDLLNPPDAAAQMAVGDAWWDLSDKETSTAKDNLRDHACQWYAKALERLTGLNKTKIERRLNEVRMSRLTRGNWVDMTEPRLFNQPGKAGDPIEVVGKKGMISTAKMQFPKGEWDGISVRILLDSAKDGSGWVIYEPPNGYAAFVDSERKMFVNARGDTASWNFDFKTAWHKEEEALVTILIGDGEYIVYLNAKEMTRVKTSKTRFSNLELEVREATVKFDRIQFHKAD
jgi:hypothetical protein